MKNGTIQVGDLTLKFSATLDSEGDVRDADILNYEHPKGALMALECWTSALDTIQCLDKTWADVIADKIQRGKATLA